jgi:hypothetical protein
MSEYLSQRNLRIPSLSSAVQERKAARKKVIAKARKLERDSFIAMMRRRRRLQADSKVI